MTTDEYGRAACVCGYVPPTHTHADDCPVFGTQARAQAPTPAPATPAVELDAETGIWSAPTSDEAVKRFTEAWPHAATASGRESLTEALQGRIKELQLDARISPEELTAVLGAHIYGDRGPFTNDPARFSVCSRAAEDLVNRYRVLRIGGDQ